jgi:hypothetical protein
MAVGCRGGIWTQWGFPSKICNSLWVFVGIALEGNLKMSVIQLEAEVSAEQLLKAVAQMPQSELEQFIVQVNALRPRHEGRKLSPVESELLLKINQGIPAELQHRYDELIAKRREMRLTSDEYNELLSLTDQVEMLDAKRVEYLVELARIRKVPLTVLMDELGIQPPAYA